MKAKLVGNHFERDRDPKNQIGIGLGPAQYIDKFEDTLNIFNFDYEREDSSSPDGIISWLLIDADFGPLIDKMTFLHPTRDKNGNIGWLFRPLDNKYYDTPTPIIEFIIQIVLKDMTDELNSLKTGVQYYENRIAEVEDDAKKINLNI